MYQFLETFDFTIKLIKCVLHFSESLCLCSDDVANNQSTHITFLSQGKQWSYWVGTSGR